MEQNPSTVFGLTVDSVTKEQLTSAAKWARFLAILGMVFLVLMLIGTFFGASLWADVFKVSYEMNNIEGGDFADTAKIVMIAYMVVIALITFFPLLFLLRFSNSALKAVESNDQDRLTSAMRNLKAYFRFFGIIAIIFLVLALISIAITFATVSAL